MNKYFLIAGNLAVVMGAFDTQKELQAAAKLDDDAIVVTNPNEIYESLSEPQMRRLRADVAARVAGSEDPEMDGQHLFHHDERFTTKGKKMAQAQKLYDDLRAWSGLPVVADGRRKEAGAVATEGQEAAPVEKPKRRSTRAPRRNIKGHIRSLFPNVGSTATYSQVAAADPEDPSLLYSDVSITTAMSDLRSEKYCGEGGPINVKRIKAEDGTLTFERIV